MKNFIALLLISSILLLFTACSSDEPVTNDVGEAANTSTEAPEVAESDPTVAPTSTQTSEPTDTPAPTETPFPTITPTPEPSPTPATPSIMSQTWSIAFDSGCQNSYLNAIDWTFESDQNIIIATGEVVGTWDMADDQLTITYASFPPYQVTVSGAEFYGPRSDGTDWCIQGTWVNPTFYRPAGIAKHTANLLPDGQILVAGGHNLWQPDVEEFHQSVSTEILLFDPQSGQWTQIGELAEPRMSHESVTLADGRVLLVGGLDSDGDTVNTSEIVQSDNGEIEITQGDTRRVVNHTVTLMQDGQVLLVGGETGQTAPDGSSATTSVVFLFDPETNSFEQVAELNGNRASHGATLLADGRILVSSGTWYRGEVYDPTTDTWEFINDATRTHLNHSATLLADGRVLVVGGGEAANEPDSFVDIYDPATDTWTRASDTNVPHGIGHTATLLPDGRVLITGGWSNNDEGQFFTTNNAEIYDPATDTWTLTSNMIFARADHTATLMPDGTIVIIGGFHDNQRPLASAIRYNPETDEWTLISP